MPMVLTVESAKLFICKLTEWIAPSFHYDNDFHDYKLADVNNSSSTNEANQLNCNHQAVTNYLSGYGIDPCEIAESILINLS
jgi:hypothetical protein